MKNLLSRYGGHLFTITEDGLKKSGLSGEPEDESFDHVIKNKGFQMNGFTYISSYDHQYPFMGAYEKLIPKCIKIGEIRHQFLEIILQYDVFVTTSVYLGYTKFSNVFCLFIKTDFRELELAMGKIESTYDLVLVIRILGKTNEELAKIVDKIAEKMLALLVYEMEVWQTEIEFSPSKTYLGKKLNKERITEIFQELKAVENRDDLAILLKL